MKNNYFLYLIIVMFINFFNFYDTLIKKIVKNVPKKNFQIYKKIICGAFSIFVKEVMRSSRLKIIEIKPTYIMVNCVKNCKKKSGRESSSLRKSHDRPWYKQRAAAIVHRPHRMRYTQNSRIKNMERHRSIAVAVK